MKPTDEIMLQELYYSMGKQDRYLKFFSYVHSFGHKRIRPLVNIDYSTKMILVGEYVDRMNSIYLLNKLEIFKKYFT